MVQTNKLHLFRFKLLAECVPLNLTSYFLISYLAVLELPSVIREAPRNNIKGPNAHSSMKQTMCTARRTHLLSPKRRYLTMPRWSFAEREGRGKGFVCSSNSSNTSKLTENIVRYLSTVSHSFSVAQKLSSSSQLDFQDGCRIDWGLSDAETAPCFHVSRATSSVKSGYSHSHPSEHMSL